MAWKQAGLT